MSIEKITSTILRDAEDYKQEVLGQAKAQSDAVLEEAKAKAEDMVRHSRFSGEEEKAKVISRRKSVSDIDAAKVILAGKQDFIKACFDKAVEEILSMKEEEYVQLLIDLGTGAGLREGLLIFNETEKTAMGQKVVDGLNQATGGDFKLADEVRKIKGGYVLSFGQTFINNTIEALVEERRGELTAEVAKMLFAEA